MLGLVDLSSTDNHHDSRPYIFNKTGEMKGKNKIKTTILVSCGIMQGRCATSGYSGFGWLWQAGVGLDTKSGLKMSFCTSMAMPLSDANH